jgi:hydroxymethylpyrimidine pyrophosphatase-like HAD family hydrolase
MRPNHFRQIPRLAVLDIDGTLANNAHRLHHIENAEGTKDWKAFLSDELVSQDTVHEGVIRCLMHMKAEGWTFIFLTGRGEEQRATTQEWLYKQLGRSLSYGCELLMRPAGDQRVATEVKNEALTRIMREHRPRFSMAFDDDAYMWKVYRSHGIIPMKAPGCWEYLFPKTPELPQETAWRK